MSTRQVSIATLKNGDTFYLASRRYPESLTVVTSKGNNPIVKGVLVDRETRRRIPYEGPIRRMPIEDKSLISDILYLDQGLSNWAYSNIFK